MLSRQTVWLLTLVLVGIGTLVAGVLWSRSMTLPDAALPAGGGESGSAPQGVVCFGYVDLPLGAQALFPLQPGRVVEVPVHEGEEVAKGTLLLKLDDGPIRSRLTEAEAGLAVAQLQLDRARKLPEQHQTRIALQRDAIEVMRYRLAAARKTVTRKQGLADRNLLDATELAISEDHVHELEALERSEQKRLAELNREDPREDVLRAEKEVTIAQARVDQARFALNDCTLKAPQRGTPLRILVGPGDVLTGQARQPAILFAADEPMVIRAEVEQEFIGRVAEGMPVRVEDEFDANRTWPGKVERVAKWLTQRRSVLNEPAGFNDVRTVECLIRLDSPEKSLRLGQRVRVRIGGK